MKRKAIWLAVAWVVVLVLVLTACQAGPTTGGEGKTVIGKVEQPAGTTTPAQPTKTTAPAPAGKETVKDTLGRTIEKPVYGGTLTVRAAADPRDFDEGFVNTWSAWTLGMTNDPLVTVDWTKGPSGTGEADIMKDLYYPSFTQWIKPHLVESYEMPTPGTWIYHLRKGVRFQNKAPVSGREFTSADAAYSIDRMYKKPGSWIYNAHPPVSIETPDKYTLILKYDKYDSYDFIRSVSITYMVAKEVVETNNGEGLRNWKNAVGTGPYVLTDYVTGNSLTMKRNPTYWEMDPFIPGNQLPYVETFKILIIPDYSTSLAALRTGKTDVQGGISWEQRQSLVQTNKDLKQRAITGAAMNVYLPNNVAPYSDKRVRDALSMAVNRDLIINDFFHGEAERLAWVVLPSNPEFTPFDKLPQNVKDILTYNPDKAKQLLKDAGVPAGFKMKLTFNTAASPIVQDMTALLKGMWEKIGLEVTLDPKENPVFVSTLYAHKYTEPLWGGWLGQYIEGNLDVARTGMPNNHTLVSSAEYDKKAEEILGTVDPAKRLELAKSLNLYMLEQNWMITLPSPAQWVMWQPWLKRYSGEVGMGYCHVFKQYVYAWIDRELKTQMTGRQE
jgi:peptide/nickel transport system substrate-binding protein